MVSSHATSLTIEDLSRIVGDEHTHPATSDDSIDGVQPSWVVEPKTTEEAAAILKLANDTHTGVAIRGSGSQMSLGNIPRDIGLILSTRRMNRVLEHAAGDLVVRVEAGAKLRDVQAVLAQHDQWLALDPPFPDATIGGLIATNASGPRRLRYGTVRDLLIGITYVLPDGTIAKAGGRVVKNVAGYDLCKLFTGSLGTLGFIAEAIFRLHPLPAATRTVLRMRKGTSIEDLSAAVQAITHSSLVPTALDYTWDRANSVLAIRFDGVQPGVDAQIEEASRILQPLGGAAIQADHNTQHVWQYGQTMVPERYRGMTYMKISHLPADLSQVVDDLLSIADGRSLGCYIHGHAGSGITLVRLTGKPDVQTQIEVIGQLRARLARRSEHCVIIQAASEIKRTFDVWGDAGGALPLMRRVKELFDPNGIMNPGRMIGRL